MDAEGGEPVCDEVGSTETNSQCSQDDGCWYQHEKYKRYWSHYQTLYQWYNNHVYAMWYAQMMAAQHMTSSYNTWTYSGLANQASFPSHLPSAACACNCDNSPGKEASPAGRRGFSRGRRGKRKARTSPNLTRGSGGEEDHVEISEEMLEFFTKTRKHQKEWKELQKQLLAKEAALKRVDLCEVSRESFAATSNAPDEQVGSRRSSEMKTLYGKGAGLVHGMETALQLAFDRHYDLKQPKLWPNIPFNMKFV